LGLGVCALLGLSAVATRRAWPKGNPQDPVTVLQALVLAATGLAFLAFIESSNVGSGARLLGPYYAFLVLPFLLHPGHALLVRKRWWSACALGVLALAAVVLVPSPARPLFAPQTALKILARLGCPKGLLARAETVYTVYGQRATGFAPVLDLLPGDVRVVGMVTFDDPETSLWRPFGSRQIEHVCPGDSAELLRGEGIRYILVNPRQFAAFFPQPFETWLHQLDAETIRTIPLTLRAEAGPLEWKLVKLRPRE
jgi:hypothetical protein